MTRQGIVCGGTWVVDNISEIDRWPEEESLAIILHKDTRGGGPAFNMAIDLARLGAPFPLTGMGLVGNDRAGQLILQWCDEHGVDHRHIGVRAVSNAHTDVMSVRSTGKRTFFFFQGSGALLTPDDFDFTGIDAKILHLGAPGLHAKLDTPEADGSNGWVTILRKAQAAGIRTNLEMVSRPAEDLRRMVIPCLPYLNSISVNDLEAGALAGIEVVSGGTVSVAAAERAARKILELGVRDLAVVHFPGGCVAVPRSGTICRHPSVRVPPDAVAGTNGAGDAFSAGLLFGLHENWEMERCLAAALSAAAAALRSVSTYESVVRIEECLALAEGWGWRDPL